MSNELKVVTSMSYSKGNVKLGVAENNQYVDVSGDHSVHRTQEVGFAAHEALDVGEITTVGWGYFRNLDSTNYVEIGIDDGGSFEAVVKLKAGEFCFCRLASNAPYAQADTGAVDLEYMLIED